MGFIAEHIEVVDRVFALQRICLAGSSLFYGEQFAVVTVVGVYQQGVTCTCRQTRIERSVTCAVNLFELSCGKCLAGCLDTRDQLRFVHVLGRSRREQADVPRCDLLAEQDPLDRVFRGVALGLILPRKLCADAHYDGFLLAGLDVTERYVPVFLEVAFFVIRIADDGVDAGLLHDGGDRTRSRDLFARDRPCVDVSRFGRSERLAERTLEEGIFHLVDVVAERSRDGDLAVCGRRLLEGYRVIVAYRAREQQAGHFGIGLEVAGCFP